MRLSFYKNISLRTQFLVLFIVLITLTLGIFGFRYYAISTSVVTDIAEKNAYQIVKKSNETIDTKLSLIRQNIIAFTNDKELYQAFSDVSPDNDENILLLDRTVSQIIKKYFSHSQDIYSVQLATSYFTFGPTTFYSGEYGKGFIPAASFKESRIYRTAADNKGKIVWMPTYNFVDMYNVSYLRDVKIDYQHMFSAVEMLDGAITDGSIYLTLPQGVESPVLLVNFKEEFFQKLLDQSVPFEGSFYMIVSPDGSVVSSQADEQVSTRLSAPWLQKVLSAKSGINVFTINGKKMIVCFDSSQVTGWTSIIAFPSEQLVGKIIAAMRSYFLYSAFIIVIIAVITSYLISGRITNPIRKLTRAVNKTGKGDFEVKLPEIGTSEFRILIHNFNLMNERIGKLIEENYEIKIRERDAEITALNLQLDPHFMYNTLNLVNLVALENGQDEISEMIVSLSKMLKYTVKNNKDLVLFEEDFAYLQGYIYLMSKRFEGKIDVVTEVEPGILATTVPKFLLQPFVENAFVHGFSSTRSGGRLVITGKIAGGARQFVIEDNGKGISREKVLEISHDSSSSLGMKNVHQRIQIIYGDPYGIDIQSRLGSGTTVTITLPL
ncbi:sensor histidine kinase [Paenibacillus sedimenti]|uniref:histidine kinase n=1 Tax=Paenibacillus sedimenti TaxID=2770274 RepID=A0A926KQX4_9BACL|nr:sensor histidine kinase [Paenibacillus sedimenti]MBD0381511.1 sensor histidine kinase [Paenibacillus sedimenti]